MVASFHHPLYPVPSTVSPCHVSSRTVTTNGKELSIIGGEPFMNLTLQSTYAVRRATRRSHTPTTHDMKIARRILWYLAGTEKLELHMGGG